MIHHIGYARTPIPIGDADLVLDVGSGHNPHPRADLCLDAYTGSTEHRSRIPLKISGQFVIADAQNLPFKDKSIDFIIASHIAEHLPDPVQFCKEISRAGQAGYIETPSPFTKESRSERER